MQHQDNISSVKNEESARKDNVHFKTLSQSNEITPAEMLDPTK